MDHSWTCSPLGCISWEGQLSQRRMENRKCPRSQEKQPRPRLMEMRLTGMEWLRKEEKLLGWGELACYVLPMWCWVVVTFLPSRPLEKLLPGSHCQPSDSLSAVIIRQSFLWHVAQETSADWGPAWCQAPCYTPFAVIFWGQYGTVGSTLEPGRPGANPSTGISYSATGWKPLALVTLGILLCKSGV